MKLARKTVEKRSGVHRGKAVGVARLWKRSQSFEKDCGNAVKGLRKTVETRSRDCEEHRMKAVGRRMSTV